MEDSQKKAIMIGAAVACLVLAVLITWRHSSKGGPNLDSFRGQGVWVKCKSCEAEYQIDKADYFKYIQENAKGPALPALVCEKCSEQNVYRAVKCPNCKIVFFHGGVRGDFDDRCPKCGHSNTEEKRKEALKNG